MCSPFITCLACTLPSLHLVSVVFGTAIPTSLYIFGKCFSYFKYSLTLVKLELSSTAMKALVITLLVQAAIAAPPSEVTTEHGTLTLEGIVKRGADAHVRGSFRSAEGDGIRFVSTPDYLKIMTTDGENIVEASSARIQTYEGDRYAAYFQLAVGQIVRGHRRSYLQPARVCRSHCSVGDRSNPACRPTGSTPSRSLAKPIEYCVRLTYVKWTYNGAVALPSQNEHSHSKLPRKYGLYVETADYLRSHSQANTLLPVPARL